ncbi:predicted protein [Nematostella vectensis]|uniref:Uncharacterized protein n=1 Tax=Nematostella vectensis TaxID=45351 RepID=A7T0V0_NEMVE|nr:predicted protein [Nematostella vectensis]|eukprot:XP_001622518.1 predicted protein [Nematostella vectensis]
MPPKRVGAICVAPSSVTQGLWTVAEQKIHINELELLAIKFALQSFSASSSQEMCPLTKEYDTLYSLLSGEASWKDWPKTENKALWQRVYRKLKSNKFELREVLDPMTARKVQRIVHTGIGCIVAKKSELPKIVDKFYKERNGEGARKPNPSIRNIYAVLPRIHGTLNEMKVPNKIRPLLQNKAPLRYIKAKRVHERHQINQFSMVSVPVTIDGKTYKYIMSVIYIFSKILFLGPLETNKSLKTRGGEIFINGKKEDDLDMYRTITGFVPQVECVADYLATSDINVSKGSQSATFVRSRKHSDVTREDHLRYSSGMICDYLSLSWEEKLKKALNLPEKDKEKEVSDEEPPSKVLYLYSEENN